MNYNCCPTQIIACSRNIGQETASERNRDWRKTLNLLGVLLFLLFAHPSSLIPHPSSLIPHPSSLIPHPSSLIPHPSSFIPQSMSPSASCRIRWRTRDLAT